MASWQSIPPVQCPWTANTAVVSWDYTQRTDVMLLCTVWDPDTNRTKQIMIGIHSTGRWRSNEAKRIVEEYTSRWYDSKSGNWDNIAAYEITRKYWRDGAYARNYTQEELDFFVYRCRVIEAYAAANGINLQRVATLPHYAAGLDPNAPALPTPVIPPPGTQGNGRPTTTAAGVNAAQAGNFIAAQTGNASQSSAGPSGMAPAPRRPRKRVHDDHDDEDDHEVSEDDLRPETRRRRQPRRGWQARADQEEEERFDSTLTEFHEANTKMGEFLNDGRAEKARDEIARGKAQLAAMQEELRQAKSD